jgi:gliding motility-associated-like protein
MATSKKSIFTLILVAITSGLLWPSYSSAQTLLPPNQPEQNPCTPLTLCGGTFYTPYSYQGTGTGFVLASTPCSFGQPAESNTMWIEVTIATAGKLSFKIIPVDTADDYDFAVLDVTNTVCDQLTSGNAVRCNYNNNYPGSNPMGIVGLADSGTQTSIQDGYFGNPFVESIDATPGQTYLVLVNNFGHDLAPGPSYGFTIDFTTSTATFKGNDLPTLQNVVQQCSDSSLIVQLSKPIQCSSIASNGSDFVIPGIPISGASGVNCVTGGYTSQVLMNFAGHFPIGSYSVNNQTASDGSTLLDLCGNAVVSGTSTSSLPFTIGPPPPAGFLSPDTTLCIDSTIIIGATPGFAGYLWNTNATTPAISIFNAGTYTVKVTDNNGCTASESMIVTAFACPACDHVPIGLQSTVRQCSDSTLTIELSQPILCSSIASDGSDFSIPGIPIASAAAENCQGGFTSAVVLNFAGHFPTGNYTVNGEVGSDGNTLFDVCHDSLPLPASLGFMIPPLTPPRFLPADTTKCDYSTIVISATPGFMAYLWNNQDTAPSLVVTTPGTFTLQVEDSYGCVASGSITVKDSACPQYVYLPNAFTPNNDGHNDLFRPVFAGPTSDYRLVVYDRWGRLVFESKDPSAGWDGTTGGREQPAGAYVWICTYDLYEQPARAQRGTVLLIR